MAKIKSISIPESDRKAVTQYRGFMISQGQKHVTSEQAYRVLLKARERSAAEHAKEQAEKEAADKAQKIEDRARTIEELERGLGALADVCDLLGQMALGKLDYFPAEAIATFARATLASVGSEVEQALRDLGVLKIQECGYFVPDLPEEPEAREAA